MKIDLSLAALGVYTFSTLAPVVAHRICEHGAMAVESASCKRNSIASLRSLVALALSGIPEEVAAIAAYCGKNLVRAIKGNCIDCVGSLNRLCTFLNVVSMTLEVKIYLGGWLD